MIEVQKTCGHCGEVFFVEHDLGMSIDFTGTCPKCIDEVFQKQQPAFRTVDWDTATFSIDWNKLAQSPFWKGFK